MGSKARTDMQLEDYFEFLAADEIKLRGHRIWIEHVLYEYVHRGLTVEALIRRFDTLTPEHIHAVLLYYHRNKDSLDRYLAGWLERSRAAREQDRHEHSEWHERIQRLRSELENQTA